MSQKNENMRSFSIADGIALLVLSLIACWAWPYLQVCPRPAAQAETQATPAVEHFGPSGTMVGTELYRANDPLIFLRISWKQETFEDKLLLAQALLRANRAIRLEWKDLYETIGSKAQWLYESAELYHGVKPDPRPIFDSSWPTLMDWWERIGQSREYPVKVWDNLDDLQFEYVALRKQQYPNLEDEKRLDELLKTLGVGGLGLCYLPETRRFDFSAKVSERSPLAHVLNLRRISKIALSVE